MPDVVVVGAGLAGLRAAQLLVDADLDVVLLEATDRVGGRVATDEVDGFRLDRGFQVLNTAYPELQKVVELPALDLRPFLPGAAVRDADGRLHRLLDPRRRPLSAVRTLLDGLLPARDKLRLAAFSARVVATPGRRIARDTGRTVAQALSAAGLDGEATDRLIRPLFAGVLGERRLNTSAAFARLVWRTFVLGTVAVPSRGMAALPIQLAARLPSGVLCLGQRVTAVRPGRVRTDEGELPARAVLVATDPLTTSALVPPLPRPRMRALTTYYHVTDDPPSREPLLHLDGTGGPVVNTVVITAAAPSYSPDHRALISSTVLGGDGSEPAVRAELARIYGRPTDGWEHLHTAEVPAALPAFPPGLPLARPVDLGDGLFVAGDHRDTPSIQGALVSGRRAAAAAHRRLTGLLATRRD